MNTFQLICFLTVTETLNFARAAERLNVTQPAVTHQIQTLEDELGVKLFRRTTRSVEITQAGILFANDAKNIIAISSLAKQRFETPPQYQRQTFTVGCHDSSELSLLSGTLEQMREKFPNFVPVFQIVPFQHLYQQLNEENVDVVVAFRKIGTQEKFGAFKQITKIPAVCAVSTRHPLAKQPFLTEADLEREPLVLFDPQKCADEIGRFQSGIIGQKGQSDLYFCSSFDSAVAMAEANFGIAVLPQLPCLHGRRLTLIPLRGSSAMLYGAYYKKEKSPMLKVFLDSFAAQFSN